MVYKFMTADFVTYFYTSSNSRSSVASNIRKIIRKIKLPEDKHWEIAQVDDVMRISPTRFGNGMWAFTDTSRGLVNELLVDGIDTMLDVLSASYGNGFNVFFSDKPFDGHEHVLSLVHDNCEVGRHYRWSYDNSVGWLCPALFKYFESPPESIYLLCTK